ncbi:hypothetical protein CDEST_02577 [Colletotrichum destructivum]|uniref:Uncharacterized protein n=1 Tax=Colletotrichum destructivum TaxID=34406 RepID=A0AAX4I3K2_9PEZI|nr:hypothetical protein CDEST_02577 [Colletotrichum destructivum]
MAIVFSMLPPSLGKKTDSQTDRQTDSITVVTRTTIEKASKDCQSPSLIGRAF